MCPSSNVCFRCAFHAIKFNARCLHNAFAYFKLGAAAGILTNFQTKEFQHALHNGTPRRNFLKDL